MMKSTDKLFPITDGHASLWGKVCVREVLSLLMFNATQRRNRALGNLAEGESQIFICRQSEIVLLTSSSFKAHVHLLHVVIVNQAFRICTFSQVFHLPFVSALCVTVFRITTPCGKAHACVFAEL